MLASSNNFQISAGMLKIIAVISMTLDHIGATIVYRYLYVYQLADDSREFFEGLYTVLRSIGRMAFPIFAFLLVEGFLHTRRKWDYLMRLFLFAVISEFPFDLSLYRSYLYLDESNVFFTLALGLAMLILIDEVEMRRRGKAESRASEAMYFLLEIAIFLASLWLSNLIHSDYGAAGILCIYILYLFRQNRMLSMFLAVSCLTVTFGSIEIFSAVSLIPLYFYDGSRGRQNKYFFYLYYPLHLLLLEFLCYLLRQFLL